MKSKSVLFLVLILTAALGNAAFAQGADSVEVVRPASLSGPRVGLTVLSGKLYSRMQEHFDAGPVITQFGWQFEKRFFTLPSGTSGLVEWVVLIGGLEQNLFLPSLTWLVGIRGASGTEFGFGPNLSVGGVGFAIAAGVTLRSANVNFPINIAVVPSNSQGTRVSVLIGFNTRRK